MRSSEIRQAFFSYFKSRGHQPVPSSSLIPSNDPTLLFTNAGMVQFKEVFLGQESRAYSRACSSQRCVRAGGKHNDLENVGYTARHHTFFEMLGNFSFGDYFKREAIAYAWDFLTQELGLPAEKLWITVYKEDDEAADIWLKEQGVSAERFSRCGEKDNFWSMGETGPCGPCSEIFYDHGPEIEGGPPGTPEEDGDRYVEIWNLVFMQYNRDENGNLTPLPKPSVDTGMGLERIAAVVQGVHNNYDIDMFKGLISSICAMAPKVSSDNASLKVIADHIRSCAFLIVDGVIPGNEGQSYVLRRIIRRAARHGNTIGLIEPFFYRLVARLVEEMGQAYPELVRLQSHIERVLLQEEEQFARTLEHGLKILEEDIKHLSGGIIPADTAFKLYDTYGFPLDLTADIARERGLSVDIIGFEKAMQRQRKQSQSASHFEAQQSVELGEQVCSKFSGYQHQQDKGKILCIIDDGVQKDSISNASKAGIILDNTPFYAESGGQIGDKGELTTSDAVFIVEDTQKIANAIIHYGYVKSGTLDVGEQVSAHIDESRRQAIRLNHSATHLLHAALKKVLGDHVQQKGSLVAADKARFDFSHYQALSSQQLSEIEQLVNQQIRANLIVNTDVMSYEQAQDSGAVALFGEKYGDSVRVLSMGDFSKELCGGTHVARTGDIGLCTLTAESGIASGVRRIDMLTGQAAMDWQNQRKAQIEGISSLLKTDQSRIIAKLESMLKQYKTLEKELDKAKAAVANNAGGDLDKHIKMVGKVKVLAAKLDNIDAKTLRATVDKLKNELNPAVIVLVGVNNDKINVIAGITKNIVGTVPDAGEYVKAICGKGGGRQDMAQGGGKLPVDLAERLATIEMLVKQVEQQGS